MVIQINKDYITVKMAAEKCGRNTETIRRWIWSGKLRAEKVGNQLFINNMDIMKYYLKGTENRDMKIAGNTAFLKLTKELRDKIYKRTGAIFNSTELLEESRSGWHR